MEFGIFHEFPSIAGQPDAAAFDQAFELVDGAERWGLDAMWLAELHFNPERSVLSSPLILAAAIAARTKTMKIGTAVQVLPLCHPLRLAEEIATIDHLANGRLIFGVGRSGFAHTYKTYGVDYGESRERFSETLAIVKRAFTEERFSLKGKYFAYDNVRLSPRPVQKPWPEIRVAAASPDTYEEMGTMGHAIFIAARTGNLSELKPMVQVYQAAWKAAGHPGKGGVFLRVPVYVAPTAQQALSEPEESVMHFYRYLGQRIEESATLSGARAIENRAERGSRLQSISYDEVLRSKIIVGTPAQVVDRLGELRETLGLSGILAEMNCGSQIPHEQVMTSLQLLCEEVIPKFK